MTKPIDIFTEYNAMMAAGPEFSASTVVSCHCIYRNLPLAMGFVPGCAVKSANEAGINTDCSLPKGTEKTCATATGWQAETPRILLFEDIE